MPLYANWIFSQNPLSYLLECSLTFFPDPLPQSKTQCLFIIQSPFQIDSDFKIIQKFS